MKSESSNSREGYGDDLPQRDVRESFVSGTAVRNKLPKRSPKKKDEDLTSQAASSIYDLSLTVARHRNEMIYSAVALLMSLVIVIGLFVAISNKTKPPFQGKPK